MICKNCGTVHTGASALPGSGWIEFVLYLWLIFPGIIYSIWRRSKTTPTCAACGSRDLVSEDTPIGRRLVAEHYPGGVPHQTRAADSARAKPQSNLPVYLFVLAGVVLYAVFSLPGG